MFSIILPKKSNFHNTFVACQIWQMLSKIIVYCYRQIYKIIPKIIIIGVKYDNYTKKQIFKNLIFITNQQILFYYAKFIAMQPHYLIENDILNFNISLHDGVDMHNVDKGHIE